MTPLILLACAHSDTPDPDTPTGPDPTFVFDVGAHADTVADDGFDQEAATLWRGPDLRAVVAGEEVLAGGPSGLYRVDGDALVQLDADPVIDLAEGVIARTDAVEVGGERIALAGVRAVTTDGTSVVAATPDGAFLLDGDTWSRVSDRDVVDVAVDGTTVWEATADGVWADGVPSVSDCDARAVAAHDGTVVVACSTRLDDDGVSISPGVDALPTGDLTAVAFAGDTVLVGHAEGATAVTAPDGLRFDHYHGLRWLPDDAVAAVAIGADDARWFATSGGLARVERVATTLAEKADREGAAVDAFWRLDFVADEGWRADPWSDDAPTLPDFDNDGLWTSMQIAAWSFAAATTGDDAYCDAARRAEHAMALEVDVPAVSFEAAGLPRGFVARSLVRDDEPDLWATHVAEPNWHLVEGVEGHDWLWKDDTSSDETTGHFFGTPVYYDLCATDEEKAEIADRLGALAGVIVDDGFVLTDLDGQRTTWGYWDPDHVNVALDGLDVCIEDHPLEDCAGAAYGAGWLQGLEILGHLLAAWHVTGDARFYDAYEHLVTDERYAEVIDWTDDVLTVTNGALANHSDHELAMLAYYTLIRYEPDDARRQRWIDSLLGFYAWEVEERNPLWAAVVASALPEGYDLDGAIRTLREMPEDRREWRMDNAHRVDALVEGDDRFDEPEFDRVLPYDEIRTMKWNGNPYAVAAGGDGTTVQGPWPWLLPYWMLRYEGVIEQVTSADRASAPRAGAPPP